MAIKEEHDQEYQGKRAGEQMWAGFRYRWRKMEVAAQDRTGSGRWAANGLLTAVRRRA